MDSAPTPEGLSNILHQSSVSELVNGQPLTILSTKGISHDHWRIGSSGLALRVPRMSQWGMEPDEQLTYEATAFERASPSGHCPQLHDVIEPCEALPRGALIVDLIEGRPPRLPDDVSALADAFVAIHRLPLPTVSDRQPLQIHTNPVLETLSVIETQAEFLPKAELSAKASEWLAEDLEWARNFAATSKPEFAPCLVGTDTHPGNFLIDETGKAWFVDLEKALYGAAPIDLAHATLAVATGWDPDIAATLTTGQTKAFYQCYLSQLPEDRAKEMLPWLIPLRRLTWLRTMTWFARWQTAWQDGEHPASRDAAMTAHIAQHIATSFDPEVIQIARKDWLEPALEQELRPAQR